MPQDNAPQENDNPYPLTINEQATLQEFTAAPYKLSPRELQVCLFHNRNYGLPLHLACRRFWEARQAITLAKG